MTEETVIISKEEADRKRKQQNRFRLGVRPMFAWYDLWVGVYIDRDNRRAFILPFPCVGIVVWWN